MNKKRSENLIQERSAKAVVALLIVTAAWGSTFVIVQDAVAHLSVTSFLAWRFLLAGAVLGFARPRALKQLGRQGWLKGVVIGLALGGGYLLQTAGLRYTSAAVSGLLTGLAVIFTPFLAWIVFGQRPTRRILVGAVVATCGLAVMSSSGITFGLGATLTLGSAVMFAGQIVGLSRWSSKDKAYGLATVQLLTVAAMNLLLGGFQGLSVPSSSSQWWAIVLTALVATAFAFVIQSWAQAQLSPGRTALVLTMEPVFAALTAWIVGQNIGLPVLVGGVMVVGAMLVVDAIPGSAEAGRARLDAGGIRDERISGIAELNEVVTTG